MKLRRIVTLLAVALVLGAMLALSATAEIAGGNGNGTGIETEATPTGIATGKDGVITVPDGTDGTKNYLISPVTLKDEKTDGYYSMGYGGKASVATITEDVWTKLDSTQELAGLYKIAEADASGNMIPPASYVYVNGKLADVQAIAKTATGVDHNVGTKWMVGKWIGIGCNDGTNNTSGGVFINTEKGYVTSVHGSHTAQVYGKEYKDIWFIVNNSSTYPNPAVLIRYTEDNDASTDGKKVTKALYAEAVGKYSMKYALTAKEIIPTTMFNSFTYGLSREGSIDVGATDTKLQVLVYNANEEVFETYEAIASNMTSDDMGGKNKPSSKHTITADELTLVGGETKTKLSALGDGYYIMGYEIFPAVNVTEDDLEILDEKRANQFFIYIYYNEYDIDVPVFEKPNASFDAETSELTISNYDSDRTYGIAPVTFNLQNNLDGSEISNAIKLSKAEKLTLNNGVADLRGRVGLFGIVALGDEYALGSEDYSLIYIKPSDATLKQLGTINPNDSKKVLFESSYDWIAGSWSGAELMWSDLGNTNDGNRFLFRDEFTAFSYDNAQTMWFYQHTKEYVLAAIEAEQERANAKLAENKAVYPATASVYQEGVLDNAVAAHYEAHPESGTAEFLATNPDYRSFMETALAPYKDRHIQYLMTQDEIIPARDLVSIKMMTYKVQGAIDIGEFRSRLVVYVLQGDTIVPVDFFDKKTYSTASRQDHEYDLSEKLANMAGYVVALRFYPWYEIEIDSVKSKPNHLLSKSNLYRFTRTTPGAGYYMDGYRIKERIAAPVAKPVEGGDAITVADPNAEYEYLYKAVGDEKWKALDEENVGLFDKAGTKYVVKIADGKYCYESPESNEVTSHGFVATGTSLLLSGDIGIKTTFDVSDAAAFEDLKFFDTATGEVKVVKDANSVTIYVPAKDKTKNFEYRYTCNDKTVTRSFETIASYIGKFSSVDDTENDLISALGNYTDYSAVYFGVDGATANGTLSNDLASVESSDDYTKPNAAFDEVFKEIYRGTALILEGKTAIRHYFTGAVEAYEITVGGNKVEAQLDESNGFYYVDVEDISASNYDEQYEVAIGNNTVKYSVLNYLVNSVKKDKTELVNLVKAMYDYHKAAVAFEASK